MIKFNWIAKVFASLVLWTLAAISLPAQTLTTLYTFHRTDGRFPVGALLQGTDGNLYGTTEVGGDYSSGNVFKISPSGAFGSLYNFDGGDGSAPQGTLVEGVDGNFYGTTPGGGDFSDGEVFSITPKGALTVLHSFAGIDGGGPIAGLILATNGVFYGTTVGGGPRGLGTIFKITMGGVRTTLHDFGGKDGSCIFAGLVQGADGNFYGTAQGGGDIGNQGTVYEITPNGTLTTLHKFNGADGQGPYAGLAQGADGEFYGTTFAGGTEGFGTVFEIAPTGKFLTLHNFDNTDGAGPYATLLLATDGNFYGTTYNGGTNNSCSKGCGTIFKLTPSGTLTTIYNFCSQGGGSCSDGYNPSAALIQDTNGAIYGSTLQGGANNDGTIFTLSLGLKPFVETQPATGAVGAAINILGTNLTGASSVTFNGVAAAFTVVSQALITTTVPAGAASGRVQVITPGRTLTSNVAFRVEP